MRALWLSRDELLAQPARLRSPLVMRCIDDYLLGKRQPLDSVACLDLETAMHVAARWSICRRPERTVPAAYNSRRANPEFSESIVVGMSGGVDSAVAALLLQRAGFEVQGCT